MHMYGCTRMQRKWFQKIKKGLFYLTITTLVWHAQFWANRSNFRQSMLLCFGLFLRFVPIWFLTSYSIIWSYQSSHLHIIQTNNLLWGKCNGTTQHTYYLSNNNLWVKFSMYVDVSYMDYCCTIWVLFNCSTRAWYAHAQLYQNAM